MTLPASLQYLDPLLDELVEMAVADVRAVLTNENGAESGQEQRRRGDQASETVPLPAGPPAA